MRRRRSSLLTTSVLALLAAGAPGGLRPTTSSTQAKATVARPRPSPSPALGRPDHRPEGRSRQDRRLSSSADQRNGGARGVGEGVEEAAKVIGWTFRVIDGQGTVAGVARALEPGDRARSPTGSSLGGFDARAEQASDRGGGQAGHQVVVGWHGDADSRARSTGTPVFFNITTDPLEGRRGRGDPTRSPSPTARPASSSSPTATYAIAIAKSDAMAAVIKKCGGCKVLSVEDTPLADVSNRMPQLTTSLLQRYGDKWTYALGINDLYFDFMAPVAGRRRHRRRRPAAQHLRPATAARSPISASAPASTRSAPSPSRCACRAGSWSTS